MGKAGWQWPHPISGWSTVCFENVQYALMRTRLKKPANGRCTHAVRTILGQALAADILGTGHTPHRSRVQ